MREIRDPLVNPTTVSGVQRGTGILSSNTAGAMNTLEIANSDVEQFQKTGVVARNTDVYIHDSAVHGFGPQAIIGQNGIQLSSGSTGEVSGNVVDGLGFLPGTVTPAGLLVFDNEGGLVVSGNTFIGTGEADAGIYLVNTSGATISGNTLSGHDYGVIDYGTTGAPNQIVNDGAGANSYANIGDIAFYLEPDAANTAPYDADGTPLTDYLVGGAGDDMIDGHGGDDTIDGGAGTDVAHYAAVSADDIAVVGGAWTVSASGAGTDTLYNVEKVSDGTHTILLVGADGYPTIQAAIDAAASGDVILLAAGDYYLTQGLDITKSVSILGANHGLDGTDAGRGAESVIHGPSSVAILGIGAGNTITIDGVQLDGSSIVNAGSPGDVFTLANSVLNVTNQSVPNIYFGYGGGYDFTFADNKINSTGYSDGTLFLFQGGVAHVTGNSFNATGSSPTDHAVALNLNGISGEVTGNSFNGNDIGALVAGTAHDLTISDNMFANLSRGDTATEGYAAGILLFDPHYTGTGITISDNTFANSDSGIRASGYNNGSVSGLPITIDDNVFSNNAKDVVSTATGVLHLTDNTVDAASVPSYYVGGTTADSITGTGGADLIEGNGGDDSINAAGGNDTIDGGAGTDTLVLSAAPTSVVANGDGSYTVTSADGTDRITNVEIISGGGQSALLIGNGGFGTIQAAIDAASPGHTILVAAGSYAENVTVNKANLTITGLGQVTVQGSFLTDNNVSGDLKTFLENSSSYVDAAGNGVTITASGVTLNNLDVSGFNTAVSFTTDVANTTLNNLDLLHNLNGVQKTTTANLDGLTVSGGSISDGYVGMLLFKAVGAGNEADGVVTGLAIDGTSYSHLSRKGIYTETLTDSSIRNVTMNDVGQYGSIQGIDGSSGAGGNGINLNLKAGTYDNIVIENFHLTDTGASDRNGADASGQKNGGAIVIEARDDGGTYGPAPAVVTDAIVVRNGTIEGRTSTAIQVGEPTKANADPDVNVSNVTITGADHTGIHGDIANETQSTLAFAGTSAADSVFTAATSTGKIVFTGGGGNDSFTGHNEFDEAVYSATLSKSNFTATGTGWTVNADAGEGTDTLTGVEKVTDGAGHHFFLVGSGGYTSIQAAVDAAATGDTILVAAGSFTETVTVAKGLIILGAKSGIDGAASGRGVANGTGESTLEGRIIIATSQDLKLDGLRFLDSAASGISGAAAPAVYVTTAGTSGAGRQIINSVFYSTVNGGDPSQDDRAVFVAGSTSGQVTVSHNYFTGSTLGGYNTASWGRAIWSDGNTQTLDFKFNTFQSVRSGFNLDGYNDATTTVANNSFILASTAISVGAPTGSTYAGIHDNLFQSVDTDVNLRNLSTPVSIDLTASGNTSSPGQITFLESGSGADTIKGTNGVDYILGKNGDDRIAGGGGDDQLDGGAGTDTAVYSQTITGGMLTFNSNGTVTVTTGGAEGTDTLTNFEFITDGTNTYSLSGNSPVSFTSTPVPQAVTEDVGVSSGRLTATTSATFADLNATDTHMVSGTIAVSGSNAHASAVAGGLTGSDYSLIATVDENGRTVGYTWSISNAAVQGLAAGDSLTFTATETISDGSSTSSQDVVLVVNGANDAPTTSPVALGAGNEDTSRVITKAQLLANAQDVDGNTLNVTGLSATSGTIVDNGNGTYTYAPVANYSGAVTLNYSVTDGTASTPGSASLAVTPVSDTPTLSTANASGNEGTAIPLTISSALTDTDGSETLSIGITGVPNGATLSAGTNNGGGSYTLTQAQLSGLKLNAPANLIGDVTLNVTATSTDGAAAPASLSQNLMVHINPGTGGIVAATDTLIVTRTVTSDLSLVALTGNDTGGTGPLAVTGVSNATGGTVAIVNGRLALTASAASGGFDYQLTDGVGHVRSGHANFTSLVATVNADTLSGGTANGADLAGGAGNDTLRGSTTGITHFVGGTGDDYFYVYNANGAIVENLNEGNDKVAAFVSYTLGANVEQLILQGSTDINGTGNELDNMVYGNTGNNVLTGGAGRDTISGGAGNDTLVGGAGTDTLTGGAGADKFVFNGLSDFESATAAERVTDFKSSESDKLDFSNFDANANVSGVQGFTFIGSGAFTNHAGELRTFATGGNLNVLGDVDGDGVADFTVTLVGISTVSASDFLFHV